jgi:hypothetical protein
LSRQKFLQLWKMQLKEPQLVTQLVNKSREKLKTEGSAERGKNVISDRSWQAEVRDQKSEVPPSPRLRRGRQTSEIRRAECAQGQGRGYGFGAICKRVASAVARRFGLNY